MGVPTTDTAVKTKKELGVRHVQAILLCAGLVLAHGMRVTVVIVIVLLTDMHSDTPFNWSKQIKGMVISSFFWGYIIPQIPGGILATRIGGSVLITISLAVSSITSFLMPLGAICGGWKVLCGLRIVQGLAQGCILPSVYNLLGKWAPVEERSRLSALVLGGSGFGYAVQFLISGYLVKCWGWPTIFYLNGFCGAVWIVFYMMLGSDAPQTCETICEKEKLLIQNSLGQVGEQKNLQTPWKAIFTSVPFFALIVVHCAQNWCFWTLMTEIPLYMKRVLGVDISNSQLMVALPYISMFVLSFFFGFMADYLPNNGWLTVTTTRKLSNSIGLYGPALALICISLTPPDDAIVTIVLLTLVVGINVGYITGLMLVHLDMSPNFAGTLFGITNFSANIVFIIVPMITEVNDDDKTDASDWIEGFCIASAVCVIGNTFYLIFGTSELQKWNVPKTM